MAQFMEQGHWERHIRRMRMVYKKRHDTLLRSLENHFGKRAVVIGQGAGLHVVIKLTDTPYSEAEIIDRARQKGVQLLPFSDFYAAGQPETTTLLLGFGGMNDSEIERGIALLAQLCFSKPLATLPP
jgi:GntR family transcriptional regulator/MocR family aminotransferase